MSQGRSEQRESTAAFFGPGQEPVSADDDTVDITPEAEDPAGGSDSTSAPHDDTAEEKEATPLPEGYEIRDLLGRGGMGEVYLAIDRRLGRRVALKRMRADRANDQELIRRFVAEARITATLQHPGIVPVYRLRGSGAGTYYTMRPIEGQTLAQILDRIEEGGAEAEAEWSIPRLVRYFLQAAGAIAFAHAKGVVHRDLKPSNIMLGPFEEVLVLDWGMAKWIHEAAEEAVGTPPAPGEYISRRPTGGSGVIGTPGYMAPEQIRGEPATELSDVFALGVMLYEILALRLPWPERDLEELLERMEEPPPCPTRLRPSRDIPPALADVARKAIRYEPGLRYASVNEFAQAVSSALEGRAVWSAIRVEKGASEWIPSQGRVERVRNRLRFWPQKGGTGFQVFHRYGFAGNVRVEFDMILSKGRQFFAIVLSAPEAAYTGGTEGYTLAVSSLDRRLISLVRAGRDVAGNRQPHLEPGKRYHVVAERRDGRIRLLLNDEALYVYTDPIPLLGMRLGFIGRGPGVTLENVTVYSHGMSAQVSCLMVPDTLYNRQLYDLALLEYRRIARSLPGRREGRIAGFRAGLCLVEMAREEEDTLERDDLLTDAESAFDRLAESAPTALSCLGRSVIASERGDVRLEADEIGEAFRRHGDDPQIGMVREWLLSRIHSLGRDDRRALASLLPYALRFALESWGRQALLERVELIYESWETPWFFENRELSSLQQRAGQEEANLLFGFWAANPLVMEEAVRRLLEAGELRAEVAGDLVAGLLEMAAVTEARAWLAFFEEHAADLFPRLGEGWLALLRLGVLALEGELHEASELLGRTPLEIGSRRVNHARLLLAEAALAEGRPEMARAVLAPLDRQDAFGRERIAWLHLRLGEWDAAEVYILPMVQKEAHRSGRSLANVLYGALLLARGKDKAAAEVFALLPDRDFPRTWTLGAYDESGRLGGGDVVPSWLFPWERRDLERHRALLRHVRGDHERARRHRAEAEAVMRRSVSRDRDLPGPPQSPLIRF